MEDDFFNDLDSMVDPNPAPQTEEPIFGDEDGDDTAPVLNNPEPVKTEEPSDFITDILKAKGFADRDNITIYDEDGDPTTIKFDDLTREEQLDLVTADNVMLSNDETNMINFLRSNNMTFKQYVDGQVQRALDNSANNAEDKISIVNNATDEELYKVDLRHKYPDLTEEEIENELDSASLDAETFKKKCNAIRKNFLAAAEQDIKENNERKQLEEQAKTQQLYESLNNAANDIDFIQGIQLEDQDKDDVMAFLLEKDINGQSQFEKLLQDPNALFKLAWFATKGEEAMQLLHRHYRDEIKNARRLGKEVASLKKSNPSIVKREPGKASDRGDDRYSMSGYFN